MMQVTSAKIFHYLDSTAKSITFIHWPDTKSWADKSWGHLYASNGLVFWWQTRSEHSHHGNIPFLHAINTLQSHWLVQVDINCIERRDPRILLAASDTLRAVSSSYPSKIWEKEDNVVQSCFPISVAQRPGICLPYVDHLLFQYQSLNIYYYCT